MNRNSTGIADCKVCLVAHDEEIHSATLNVKRWFAGEVTKNFEECDDSEYFLVEEPAGTIAGSAA
jgi:hypothetical protein